MRTQSNILKWLSLIFLIRLIYLTFKQIQNLYLISNNDKKLNKIFGIEYPEDMNQSLLWIVSIFILASLIYLIYHLFNLIRIAQNLIDNKVFTNKNANQLHAIGIGIIVFTSILIIAQTTIDHSFLDSTISAKQSNSYNRGYALGTNIAKRMYLYMISLFILIISSLIKNGNIIKQENDLTI